MSDLISRQATIDVIKNHADMLWEKHHKSFPESTIMEMIQALPSVEPEREHGKWIWNKRTGEYECSECGCNPCYERHTPDISEIDKYKFCRWCGAPMEVEK